MNYAGKLLVESDRTVAEIAYESGFRNISNFNRQFLKVRGRKPGEFRKLRGDQT
jgi:AraC-like DNA-binding protein